MSILSIGLYILATFGLGITADCFMKGRIKGRFEKSIPIDLKTQENFGFILYGIHL